jgi:hypothetical protein
MSTPSNGDNRAIVFSYAFRCSILQIALTCTMLLFQKESFTQRDKQVDWFRLSVPRVASLILAVHLGTIAFAYATPPYCW